MKRFGFSRWELLALGAVVTVFACFISHAKGPPSDKEGLEDYRALTCQSNLKQIAEGLLQYQQDYDEKLPLTAFNSQAVPYSKCYGWTDAVMPYIRSRQVFQCPAEKHKSEKHEAQDAPKKPNYTDYWLNTNVAGAHLWDIRLPAAFIIVGDGDGGAANSNARYNLNKLPKSWLQKPQSPARRHWDKGHYAFADGHVEALAPLQVGKPNATFALK